ncbi:radiation sensitive protein rad9 [Maublancomyces gigas]|uniref:Radiation sensitive protein rad9 n=1 Tax=Discina gigas TaxID=1032678 RepID=A0ABR3GE10_9PEZI
MAAPAPAAASAATPDPIDIARLQGLLGKDLESLPVTQVINSPPPPPPPPRSAKSPVPRTPGTHVTHSHDHAGNLSLAYSNSLSYSQVDLGDTQADAVLFGLTPSDRPADPVLMSASELDLEMVRGTPEGSPRSRSRSRSRSPSPSPSPGDPAGHNPLAHMPFSSRMPMSLAQMFDVASSPRRPLAGGTSLPPTPSAAGATRLMARALSRMPSSLLPPTALGEEEEEEDHDDDDETTPMGSPTQADAARLYVPMQESQEAHERESRKRRHRGRRNAPFGGSVSPVVFSSSFAARPQESEDEMLSDGEEIRRRADRARRKGDEEVKRLFMAVKGGRVENTGRARSEGAKTSVRGGERPVGAALKRRQTKSASPAGEDTGDEEEEEAEAPAVALNVSTEEDDVSLPMNQPRTAARNAPENAPEKQRPSAPQYTQLLPQAWESLHQVPIAAAIRRTRPTPTALRHESSALSERPPSRGYAAAASPPGSAVADSQQLPPLPGPPQKTWLRSLPPFNIPSPPHRILPEFVRETSGLVAPEMTSSPAPLRTMVPETSPCRREEGGGAAGKRKRRLSPGEDRVPCSVEETRGFGAMEAAAGFLSSRPEPDDVDMLEIVADVGAGRDLEGMGVTPRAGWVDSGRGRRRSAKRVKVTPKPADVARLGSKSRPLIRKTRSSGGLGVVAAPDTPTPVTAAAAAAMDTDDDEADVLVSRDPAFSLSVALPPPPSSLAAVAPGRVFALFRDGRNSYHPATVKGGDPYTGTVRVVFDDGTEDLLERAYVRALDLRVGDCVKVDIKGMKKVTWEVQGFADTAAEGTYSDCRGHTTVLVKARKTAGAGEASEVQVTNMYLVKGMWKEFDNRVYRGSLSLSQVATPEGDCGPPITPSKVHGRTPVSASLGRTLGGGLFAGMVFALSFGDKESVKKAVTTKILQNGGRIVDVGFEELFYDIDRPTTTTTTASSSFSSSDTTAAATSPIHFTPRPETNHVGFTAVIADAHSRRAKFLQALALGLPCLAPRWIEDCCRRSNVVDWEHYLLPAGESRYLGTVRSRVLERYDARTAWMRVVVAKRERLLRGRGVVVVAGGGARACERRKPYLFLTYALGAARVARAVDLEGAQMVLEAGEKWDFVYVEAKDKEQAEKMWSGGGGGKGKVKVKVVDDEWVVQSLILGRLIADD